MEKNLYTVLDNVSKIYSAPMVEINNGTMTRGLMDLMSQNPNHPYSKFPDNYTLINLGTWNEDDGIPTFEKHTVVAELVAIKLPTDMEK